jgi:hypothetical protein
VTTVQARHKTCDWYKRFENSQTSIDYDDISERLSAGITSENVAQVRNLILQDGRLTIQDLRNILGLSLWYLPTNFVRGTEHEEDCGEVSAMTAAK